MALIAKGQDCPQMSFITWGTQDGLREHAVELRREGCWVLLGDYHWFFGGVFEVLL